MKAHDYYYGDDNQDNYADNSQYGYNGYDNGYDNGYNNGYYPPQQPQAPMPPQDNGYGYGYGYGYGNGYDQINDEDQDNDGDDQQQQPMPPPPQDAGAPPPQQGDQPQPPMPPQGNDGDDDEPPPPPPGQGDEPPPPPADGDEPPPPPGQGDEPPPPPPPLPGTTQQDDDYDDIGLGADINIIHQEPNIGRTIKFGYAEIFIAFICIVLICCGIALCWNKKKYGPNMKKLIDIDDDHQYHYDYATFSNV